MPRARGARLQREPGCRSLKRRTPSRFAERVSQPPPSRADAEFRCALLKPVVQIADKTAAVWRREPTNRSRTALSYRTAIAQKGRAEDAYSAVRSARVRAQRCVRTELQKDKRSRRPGSQDSDLYG